MRRNATRPRPPPLADRFDRITDAFKEMEAALVAHFRKRRRRLKVAKVE